MGLLFIRLSPEFCLLKLAGKRSTSAPRTAGNGEFLSAEIPRIIMWRLIHSH